MYILKTVETPGWDAGARSIDVLPGNGQFSFSMGTYVGAVVGLNDVDNNALYGELDHALFLEAGQVRVVEKGVFKTAATALPPTAPTFHIRRIEGVVSYYVNDTLLYTSLAPSTGTVFLDCSLYAYGDTIAEYSVEEWVTISGALAPLVGIGSDTLDYGRGFLAPLDGYGEAEVPATGGGSLAALKGLGLWAVDVAYGSLPPLIGAGEAYQECRLAALVGEGFSTDYEHGQGSLASLKGIGYDFYAAPEYNYGTPALAPLAGYGIESLLEAQGAASLAPLCGLGLETNDPFAAGYLPPLTAEIWVGESNYIRIERTFVTLRLEQNSGVIRLAVPAPEFYMEGEVGHTGMVLRPPAPLFQAFGGGSILLMPPAPLWVGSGFVEDIGTIFLEVPSPSLVMEGVIGSVATLWLRPPAPSFQAFGGGTLELLMPSPVFEATGSIASLATLLLRVPAPEFYTGGVVGNVGGILLEIPAPTFYIGDGNRIHLLVEAPTLTVTGFVSRTAQDLDVDAAHAAVVAAAAALAAAVTEVEILAARAALAAAQQAEAAAKAAVETTYAVNVTTGAVTRWVMGRVDRLVTAHGRLYGLREGVLVRLEGETDGDTPPTPIPVTVRLAPATFGTDAVKRLTDVYLSMRENDGITLDVIADEVNAYRYQTRTDAAPAYGTHKVAVGRGTVFHTVGLVVRNRNGGRFALGGITVTPQMLSRKPR